MEKVKKRLYKTTFIALGLLSVSIGAIVRFVPGIPTTPFLLLALYCFNKSSDRLSLWLKNTYLYKKYLAEYVSNRAMSIKQKLSIQLIASTMMVISFITIDNLIFRVIMVMLFFIHHYFFIFRIKTYRPDMLAQKKGTVHKMVSLYCRKNHQASVDNLCTECVGLLEYAYLRTESCPYIESKTSCSRCKTPCYSQEMRKRIRATMRWAGPRMLLYHPVLAIKYILDKVYA